MSDQRQRPSRIPTFADREDEATWWDNHDAADFWDELEPVNMRVSPALLSESTMTVCLPEATLQRLRDRAAKKGVGHLTLARMWIMERLEQEEEAGSRPASHQ